MNRLELLVKHISSQRKLEKIELKVCPVTNIGFITMNSPKDLNSLGEKMIDELSWALGSFQRNSQVNAIVIKSSHPKIFCAGADIKRFLKQDHEYYLRTEIVQDHEYYIRTQIFNPLETAFKNTKKPIISAVNGKALGGGFELALLSDIIVASQNAFFALPEVSLGLMPGIGGTQRLTKIIGQKAALRYILTGDGIDAQRAYQMNVCELVKSQNFDENVVGLVKKITQKAVSTIMVAKRAVKFASDSNLSQGLQFQKSTFYPLFATKAAKQGILAFVEKRKPIFKGL